MGGIVIFRMKGRVSKDRSKKRAFTGIMVLMVLALVSSSAVSALEETNNSTDFPFDVELEGIDEGLVTDVWIGSMDFAEEMTQNIDLSEEGAEGEGAIDNLIIMMRITLAFTADVIDTARNNDTDTDTETEEGMNLTAPRTSFMVEEQTEDAFQYLRLLQSGNLCEEAINIMEASGTGN